MRVRELPAKQYNELAEAMRESMNNGQRHFGLSDSHRKLTLEQFRRKVKNGLKLSQELGIENNNEAVLRILDRLCAEQYDEGGYDEGGQQEAELSAI